MSWSGLLKEDSKYRSNPTGITGKLVLKIGHVGLQVIYAESHSFPASAVANGPSARSRRLAVLDGKPSVCDRADGARDSCGFQ